MTQSRSGVQLRLSWGRCTNETWCLLNSVNLSHQAFDANGVYMIWHGGDPFGRLDVGQGAPIRNRLSAHRDDPRIQAYAPSVLYVTWASVSALQRDGVEVYLANRYHPLVGDRHPDATPVNGQLPLGIRGMSVGATPEHWRGPYCKPQLPSASSCSQIAMMSERHCSPRTLYAFPAFTPSA